MRQLLQDIEFDKEEEICKENWEMIDFKKYEEG